MECCCSPHLQVGLLDFGHVSLLLRVLLFSSSSSSPMTPIHKSSSPGTGLSLLWPPYTNLPQLKSVRLHVFDCFPLLSPVLFPSFASQSGIEILLLNLAWHGWGSLDANNYS